MKDFIFDSNKESQVGDINAKRRWHSYVDKVYKLRDIPLLNFSEFKGLSKNEIKNMFTVLQDVEYLLAEYAEYIILARKRT